MEPTSTTPRKKRLTASEKRAMLEKFPTCFFCGEPFSDGDVVEWDHAIALGLMGADALENLRPIHAIPCHKQKTKKDMAAISKAKRIQRKLYGKPKKKRSIPSRPMRQNSKCRSSKN